MGAAIGTLATEVVVCVILVAVANKYNKVSVHLLEMVKCFIATIPFFGIFKLYQHFYREGRYYYLIFVALSALAYYVVLLILRNKFVLLATDRVLKKLRRQ